VKWAPCRSATREGIAGFKLINLMGSVWKWKQASQLAIGEMRSISNFKVVPPASSWRSGADDTRCRHIRAVEFAVCLRFTETVNT